MIIEDEELRSLYKASSSEHIQNIEAGILHLEKHPQDTAKLEELLREAHSLKGDSRMLGVVDVETLIHQIEEIFTSVKKGETNLTSDLCDRLYKGVDAVGKIAHEAVTGEPSNVKVFQTLAQLMGAVDLGTTTAPPAMPANMPANLPAQTDRELADMFAEFQSQQENAAASQAAPQAVPAAEPQDEAIATGDSYQIDTLRVEASRLDRLLTQASELLVTQGRFSDRTGDLQAIQALWEEWSRETFVSRMAFDELERRLQTPELKPIQRFYHQVDQRLERLGSAIAQLKNATDDDTARLEIVSNDLESGIRAMRLLPMSSIFGLFPRLVRDIAKQLGKEVNLIVEGGDTRADKQILEGMKAPLTHLIRNAVDHGIESPDDRQRQGKPRAATIRLRAYQTASSVCIEIQDDGRASIPMRLNAPPCCGNCTQKPNSPAMSTAQIQSLIFAPGFS
ncbi:MAG: hybrid sensor histidine kinase/response regulator, partial [Leptolyngbyaceae cyanobacterium CRU_2_3]|nr:hybrid sensor histidine kinase/response regulator [Leptolyngbyaceae cyanobacterium CRU_2_3]